MASIIPLSKQDDAKLTTQGVYPSSDDLKFVAKCQDWWEEADKAATNWLQAEKAEHEFALGHQWDKEDYEAIKQSGRYPLILNKTLAHILVVSGYERTNRMRVRYLPVEAGDDLKAEVWTEVARDQQEKGDLDWNKSDAFFDALKGGRGFVHVRLSYEDNPAGDVVSDLVPPWELRIDPTHRSYDLKDARYVIWTKDVSLEELLVLWPEKAEQILHAQQQAMGKDHPMVTGDRDSDYDSLITRSFDKITKKWALKEVWYWQVEKTAEFMVQNPQTQEWNPVMKEEELKLLLLEYPELQWKRDPRYERKYYQAFIAGPLLLQNEPSYLEYKGFPFVPFYGLWDAQEGRYVGMVYHLKDPQIEVNKRRTQTLHIVNRAAKSGWIGPKGSFVDRDRWEKESALPGVVLEYETEPGQNPPAEIKPDTFPTAIVQLEQMATNDLREIGGVNIHLQGLDTRDVPGVLDRQRKQQGMITLQPYFDNLRRSTKILGRLLLSIGQQFYTDGRQYVISGQPVQLGEDYRAGRYDLVVEESPYSPNQKMETAAKLQEVVGLALKAGIPIPPEVLDYSDLPESLVEKWKQMLQQARQEKTDPKIQIEMQKLQIQMREQIRKEVESHFKNILTVAKAESEEAGTQLGLYQAFVNQFNAQQDRQMAAQQQAQAPPQTPS